MKRQLDISLIDNNIFYNLIQRGSSSSKNKNNFIIYDISGGESVTDEFQNFLSINEEVSKLLMQNKEETIKLTEISKSFPKDKEELFSKSKRCFNFLLMQPKDSYFLNFLNQVVIQLHSKSCENIVGSVGNKSVTTQQERDEQKHNRLLLSGQIKLECDLLQNEVERLLKENPEIEARCNDSVLNFRKTMAFYKVLKNNKINEIHIVRQSAAHFFTSYPFMRNYFVSLNSASQQTYPNDILSNRLYFGNWKHASNEEIINSIGITHIVNMTCEVDNYFSSNQNISYLKINIDDEDTSNILQHFKETYQFIAAAIKIPTNKILIHCAQGKSRSATIVCMYLMRTFKWNFEQTLKYVQDRREVANPNYGFVEQIKKFENNNFMFEGETPDELIQSQGNLNSLSDFKDVDITDSPTNVQDINNVKKQQVQDFSQLSNHSNSNYITHICN